MPYVKEFISSFLCCVKIYKIHQQPCVEAHTYNTNTRVAEARFQIQEQPKLHNEALSLKRKEKKLQ